MKTGGLFMRMNYTRLTLVLVLARVPTAMASTTWYVNGLSGNNSNNCRSPQTACRTTGHGISLAASGDSIMVAATTYRENLNIGRALKVVGSGTNATIIAANDPSLLVVRVTTPITADRP